MLLSPGKHHIKITLPGYQSFDTEIEVRANQKYDIKTQLPKGSVSICALPWTTLRATLSREPSLA